MEGVHTTFLYLHMRPFRRHLLQCRDDGRVQLLSAHGDFTDNIVSSGWHGEHTWAHPFQAWTVTLHYLGAAADHYKRLRIVTDMQGLLSYTAFFAGQRWAYLIMTNPMSTACAQRLLDGGLEPPPPPPVAGPSAAQAVRMHPGPIAAQAVLALEDVPDRGRSSGSADVPPPPPAGPPPFRFGWFYV